MKLDNILKRKSDADELINFALEKITLNDTTDGRISVINLYCFDLALYQFFINHSLSEFKQYCYLSGVCFCILGYKFDEGINFNTREMAYALLSDNFDLIKACANLKPSSYDQERKNGSYIQCIQAVLNDDWDLLNEQLEINEKKLKNKKGKSDRLIFLGIMNKNKSQVEEIINLLLTKSYRSYRDKVSPHDDIISITAVCYAKLAWIKGVEVEIDHPFLPKEWLPVKPNKEYWQYDFMKEERFKII